MGMTNDEEKRAAEIYVAARVNGIPGDKAKAIAGYSPNTHPNDIDRTPAVHTAMEKALIAKGLTEDFIADNYKKGVEASLKAGAKDKDINGLSQLLRGISFLKGYGKKSPDVAIQVNNTQNNISGNPADESLPTAELIEQMSELVENLKKGISERQTARIYEGDIVPTDPAPHGRVDVPPSNQEQAGSGGQP